MPAAATGTPVCAECGAALPPVVEAAVNDHFGDRQPTETEVRAFLRQRSLDQGLIPDEVDALFAAMDPTPETDDRPDPSPPSPQES